MDSGNMIQISKKDATVSSFKRTHVDSNSEYDEKWLLYVVRPYGTI